MVLTTDILIAFPVIGISIFFIVLIAWLYQDVLPAWKNAISIGAFELRLHQGATKTVKERRFNLVDLTDLAFDKTEGAVLIRRLLEGIKDTAFYLPIREKRELISKFEEMLDLNEFPLVEAGNYALKIIGIRSVFTASEVAVLLVDKRIGFPEGYIDGRSQGWRGRNYVRGRQFYFPKKMEKFLGKRKVKIGYIDILPPNYDEAREAEKLEAARRFTTDAIPIVPLLAQSHMYEDKIRVQETQLSETRRQLATANQAGFSNLAGGVAAKNALGAIGTILGLHSRPFKGALPPTVILLAPIGSYLFFQLAFGPNPLFGAFGVIIGCMIAVFLLSSKT